MSLLPIAKVSEMDFPIRITGIEVKVPSGEKIRVHMAPGGGWAARIFPVE